MGSSRHSRPRADQTAHRSAWRAARRSHAAALRELQRCNSTSLRPSRAGVQLPTGRDCVSQLSGCSCCTTIPDELLKNAVFVPQSIPHRRDLHGCHRIEGNKPPVVHSPPLPRPASGSCSSRPSQSMLSSLMASPYDGIEQKLDLVTLLASDRPMRKLHRQVVDALWVLTARRRP